MRTRSARAGSGKDGRPVQIVMRGQVHSGVAHDEQAVPAAPDAAHFTHYLENRSLPVSTAEVRAVACDGAQMSLVSHLPNDGIWFDAIDDLIVSIVVRSDYSDVARDIGTGLCHFRERPGCVLLTPPQTPSYWQFQGSPLVLHVSVPRAGFEGLTGKSSEDLHPEFANVAHDPVYDRLISQLTTRMWTELALPNPVADRFAVHSLGTLLALLLRSQSPDASRYRCGSSDIRPLAAWRLRKVSQHIMSRLGETITLEELARLVDLSPSHLLRAFAAATDQTPHQWQTSKRIEEAKRLLRESNASMTDIALNLGFSSSAHFSTRFKQLEGMTPSNWRGAFGPELFESAELPPVPLVS